MTNPQTEARAIARYEVFADPAYFDMWAVRPVDDRSFFSAIHVATETEAHELASTLRALSVRNGELERALEPFAAIADTEDEVGRDDPDDDRIWVVQAHGCQIGDLTIEDLARARSALSKGGNGNV